MHEKIFRVLERCPLVMMVLANLVFQLARELMNLSPADGHWQIAFAGGILLAAFLGGCFVMCRLVREFCEAKKQKRFFVLTGICTAGMLFSYWMHILSLAVKSGSIFGA